MATVWEPDDGYHHGRLSKPELRWLAGKAQEAPEPSEPDETVPEQDQDKEQDRG